MDNVKHVLISLAVIFISLLFIDEGKTILLVADNIQIHLNHNRVSDLEIPHQHNHNKLHNDETWMTSDSFELSCSSERLFIFSCYGNLKTVDYTSIIWQPPKSA